MNRSGQNSAAKARRINRTWIVRGGLENNAEDYLATLEARDPLLMEKVCALAIEAAQLASAEQRDPKPDFYAALFSQATEAERETFLKNHRWTRQKSREW